MKPLILTAILAALVVSCSNIPATSPAAVPIPRELSIFKYPLEKPPETESSLLYFADTVQSDPRALHAQERARPFNWDSWTCPPEEVNTSMARCVTLGTDILAAREDYSNNEGKVIVTRNGEQIYSIAVGYPSPINGLRGLWAYDDHWALESANVSMRTEDNTVYSDVIGQITVDGELLNDQYGYENAFGFQTIFGNPFYFFKKEGKIQANYDGVDIPLGYDEIPHYGCCSAASLNPLIFQNMVAFFAREGDTWYYAEIGVFDQP